MERVMEALFAPWRSVYVQGVHKNDRVDCVFCAAWQEGDDEKHLVLARAEKTFVMMNLYPYNPGHTLIVPNRHVSRLQDLTKEERQEVMEWAVRLEGALKKAFNPDGINIGVNLGKAAGAGIEDHLHGHMVPRWNGDTNFMPVISGTKVISEALKESFRKLREALL